jgi:C-terminal processing protease CtpA/Prc
MYQTLKTLKTELGYVKDTPSGISLFNTLANRYAYLNIPGFDPIDESFCDNGMEIKAALLKGNIAYLYIDGFKLTRYMHDEVVKEAFPNPTAATQAHIENVKNVWKYWFDNIQYLHKAGTLGGVIIDVRNNTGGSMYDFNYLLGALLPSGGFEYGSVRYKRGTGRLDYSPLMPQVIYTMNEEHAIINEPIVVLANSCSVSMAEITSLCTKYIDNATLIGKRTFGGLCGLTGIDNYSYYYAGHIGEEDKTPVYVYLPLMAQYNREGQILEGIGVTPDIEVDLDVRQLDLTGKDTQLDRALEFIRNGK